MTSVGLNNLNLKYKRFEPSGCKDIGTRKFELVGKTQTLSESGAYIQGGGISSQSAPRKVVARVLYVLRGGFQPPNVPKPPLLWTKNPVYTLVKIIPHSFHMVSVIQ